MYCPKCGKETDGKFCQFCGAPLPQAEEQPAPAKRKPWLPIASIIGVAVVAAGAFVLLRGRPTESLAGPAAEPVLEPTPEPTPEATEEPVLESEIEGVSAEAYWNGVFAVYSFDEEYWKAAAKEIGEIYIEMDGRVDDPTSECLNNMPSVFENAEFVKAAQQSINAITDETEGLDYEWERFVGVSWVMKAEGTINKLINGEESTLLFGIMSETLELGDSELNFGDKHLTAIEATSFPVEQQQKACEEVYDWISDPKATDNLILFVLCNDWLESTKTE